MSNPNVETVTSTADRLKLALALLVFIAGLVGFYVLANSPMIARVGVVLAGLIVGLLIAWASEPGRRLIAFGKDSVQETKRVIWPSRKETVQTTGIVFAFTVVMAVFLWLADKSIEWVLYSLILGWK